MTGDKLSYSEILNFGVCYQYLVSQGIVWGFRYVRYEISIKTWQERLFAISVYIIQKLKHVQ